MKGSPHTIDIVVKNLLQCRRMSCKWNSLNKQILCFSLFCNTECWSFWGSETETEETEIKPEDIVASDILPTKVIEKDTETVDDKLYSHNEIHEMNKEEFEKKMEEAIKAHEIHHLSQESHFDDLGAHNADFDHEAFMGDEAKEFKNLTPSESKEKLSKIAIKIDKNGDNFIDVGELTNWIIETQNRSIVR